MKTRNVIAVAAAMGIGVLGMTGNAKATVGPEATAEANMTIENYYTTEITGTIDLTPTIAQIKLGSITTPSALTVKVATNNSQGCKLTVAAAEAGGTGTTIAASDILLKSATSGTKVGFSGYAGLSTTPADFWGTNSSTVTGTNVVVDLQIQNLGNYKAINGAETDYSNTIVFEAVANAS